MPASVQPIITRAGIDALGRIGGGTGELRLKLTHMGLSPASFDADENSTLPEDGVRMVEIADVHWSSIPDTTENSSNGGRLSMSFIVTGERSFEVGAIGLFADDVTSPGAPRILFAIESKAGVIITKKFPHDDLLISFDLVVIGNIRERIEVVGVGERLNLSVADEFTTLSQMILNLQTERREDRDMINRLGERVARLEGAR